jgi:hypothetical protein
MKKIYKLLPISIFPIVGAVGSFLISSCTNTNNNLSVNNVLVSTSQITGNARWNVTIQANQLCYWKFVDSTANEWTKNESISFSTEFDMVYSYCEIYFSINVNKNSLLAWQNIPTHS